MNNSQIVPEIIVDTTGYYCPEPLMMLHHSVRKSPPGALLKIISTDPSTLRDIPKFCHFLGHSLLRQEKKDEGYYIYWIKKAKA